MGIKYTGAWNWIEDIMRGAREIMSVRSNLTFDPQAPGKGPCTRKDLELESALEALCLKPPCRQCLAPVHLEISYGERIHTREMEAAINQSSPPPIIK